MMNSCNIFTLSTFIMLVSAYQISAESSTYTAAVVGLKAEKLLTQPDYSLYIAIEHYTNLVGYLMHNSSHKPDIIIFPEGGLQGQNEPFPIQVPSTEDSVVPCNLGARFSAPLISLSCLAKDKQVYLVVNLIESHFNISSNKTMIFNTNVAFDRDGTIVARYRKSNLNEIGYDTPGKPDISSFQTDFDVTFGLLTGSDLLFKEPMYTLKKHKVKHFIHPTKWENELPFFTGIQMQSSWAYVTNSILLSAGYNHPELGYSGVGVYQGRDGPIDYTQSESSRAFAIIADVPKYASQPKNILRSAIPIATNEPKLSAVSLDKVFNQPILLLEENIEKMEERLRNKHSSQKVQSMKSVVYRSFLKQKRDKIELFKTKLIDPVIDPEKFSYNSNPQEGVWYFGNATATINETICTGTVKNKNQFCCKFSVKMTTFYSTRKQLLENIVSGDNFTNYHYRLAVYDGIKNFTNQDAYVPGNIQVCGIIPCLTKKIESCALRTDNFETEPPIVAPPAATEVKGRNYTSVGTTFEIISIETEIKYNDSTAYPIILQQSPTTDEFGSLPSVDTFTFTKEVKNNTHNIIVSLQTNKEITDLGSISIFTRIYHIPSSSSRMSVCFSSLIASFIIVHSLVLN